MISFVLLNIIGLIKLFDSRIRHLIQKGAFKKRKLSFQFLSISFLLTIYGDPKKADIDQGQELSPNEAISLALALSIDSGIAGLSSGTPAQYPFLTLFFSVFFGFFARFCVPSMLVSRKSCGFSMLRSTWLSAAKFTT